KNRKDNRARMVAGYCWDWKSKKDPAAMDVVIPEHGFAMQWNLTKDGGLWIRGPESVREIGCIHTCQGLEVDYVGVVVGPDLIVRNDVVVTQPEKRSRQDQSIKGYKAAFRQDPEGARAKADAIIKNTYRTLMTRGMKGCYIYCVDPETAEYFRTRLARRAPEPAPAREYRKAADDRGPYEPTDL
ncbi:MAG: DNA/RNA helicase domain-containing protein, partial [Dehalococcoidia bacterium]